MLKLDMSMKIDMTSNIVDAMASMENFSDKVMVGATRHAINRGLITGRKTATKTLRERLNVKAKDMKKRMKLGKAKGGRLPSLEGFIAFNDNPMPMLNFVKGHKKPIKQKGIKVQKRRKLKAEVYRGKKILMLGAFIQKVRSTQVFRAHDSGKFTKQAAPSVAEFISRRRYRKLVLKSMRESFNKNLRHESNRLMQKEQDRLNSKPLKQPK